MEPSRLERAELTTVYLNLFCTIRTVDSILFAPAKRMEKGDIEWFVNLAGARILLSGWLKKQGNEKRTEEADP